MIQVFLLRYLAVVAGAFVTRFCAAPAAATATAPGTHLGHAVVFVGSGSAVGITGPWPLEVVATVAESRSDLPLDLPKLVLFVAAMSSAYID